MHKQAHSTSRSSWVDWLQYALEVAALPWWLILLIFGVGLILVELGLLLFANGLHFAETAPWPQIVFYALAGPYTFGYLYVLDRRAENAVKRLRPLIKPDSDWHSLASSISTMPFWPALVSGLYGLALFIVLRLERVMHFG